VRVWAASDGPDGRRLATDDAALGTIVADVVVLATGAHERVVPFPGWDLPGVMTVGGAQALLKGQGVRPGEAVVVAGAGPLLLPVAASLVAVGTRLVAVADAGSPLAWASGGPFALPPSKLAEGARYLARLARHGVLVRTRTAAIAARGDGRVEEVVLARLGRDWAPIAGSERTVAADALATSHGFAPDVAVAVALGCTLTGGIAPAVVVDADQATDVAGVLAAGEVCGIAGGDVGAHEGTLAGLAAARLLGADVDRRTLQRARRRRRRDARFVATLARVLDVPAGAVGWADDTTVVCRCEEVTRGAIDAAIGDRGARDLRSIKLTTRCGMGYCQGRMCAPNVAAILEAATGAPPTDAGALSRRPVLTPVELGRLLG
jgi:NADPH-dependent 2,4-dienoyl-CoA reductase/sulfur reductase-like enzyme